MQEPQENIQENKGRNIYVDKMFFNIYAMERMVRQNHFLAQKYREVMQDEEVYGYHKNENILNELFRLYVLPEKFNTELSSYEEVSAADEQGAIAAEGNNYERFKEYKLIRGKIEKFRQVKKKPAKVEETTTASVGDFATSTPYFLDKPGVVKKPIQRGFSIVEPNAETHENGKNSYKVISKRSMEESIESLKESMKAKSLYEREDLHEEAEPNGMKQTRKVKKENETAQKKELASSSETIRKALQKDKFEEMQIDHLDKKDKDASEKMGVKRERSSDEQTAWEMERKGVEDLTPDQEPSKAYLDRVKDQMEQGGDLGKDMHKAAGERKVARAAAPLYNKEAQPVVIVKENVEGWYMDRFGNRQLKSCTISAPIVETLEKGAMRFHLEDMPNAQTPHLVEAVQNYEFYLLGEGMVAKKKMVQESADISQFKHLLHYNTKKTKSTKRKR